VKLSTQSVKRRECVVYNIIYTRIMIYVCVCLRAPRRLVSLSFIRNGNSIRLAAAAGNFKGPGSVGGERVGCNYMAHSSSTRRIPVYTRDRKQEGSELTSLCERNRV